MKSMLLPVVMATTFLPLRAAETPLPIMGRWEGKFLNPQKEHGYMENHPNLCAEVISLGDDRYRIRLLPQFFRRAHLFTEFEARAADGVIRFDTDGWKGEIAPGSFTGEAFSNSENPLKFSLTKSDLVSPTMGMKAPEGAKILFDGKNLDAWESRSGGPAQWTVLDDSVLEVFPRRKKAGPGGNIRTKEQFEDVHLHIEFQLPYVPDREGQGRANSGIFLQGLYEVQILDSFGLGGLWNECGALYHVAPPKVNACLPPGEWQTYDILFRAARFNPDGTVSEHPRITVRHNGILVQYNVEIPESTLVAASAKKPLPVPKAGPIELQDHSHLVRFRNIWAAPLPDSAEALVRRQ